MASNLNAHTNAANEAPPPAKRARTSKALPEGFDKPKVKPALRPQNAPQFTSAFGPSEASSSKLNSVQRPPHKPPSHSKIERPSFTSAFTSPNDSSSLNQGEESMRHKPTSRSKQSRPVTPTTGGLQLVAQQAPERPSSPSRNQPQLKRPMLAHPEPPREKPKSSSSSSKPQKPLNPMHAFQLPHRQELPEATTDKPVSVMRRAPPPMPIPPNSKPETAMKQLHPPVVPVAAPASPPRNMKTITSTRVAQITDPTKDGGAAEVLSLFIQQHGHSFMSGTDRELQRGVMVSPDKRSRGGKEPKFLRGGLAERAQHVISGTQTNYTLWRRQMEQKIESASAARLSPDARFKVLKVMHILHSQDKPGARAPRAHPTAASTPRCGLALCALVGRPKLKFNVGELADGQTYLVLLPFSPSSSAAFGSAEHMQEESEIMAWMPWQSAELEGAALTSVLLGGEMPGDFSRRVLVVSRFHLLPKG